MKILVTGGAGFIGSHVVDLFLKNDYEVVVIDDLSTGRASNLNPAAAFYEADIRGPEIAGILNKEKPDYISHHAAQIDVRRSVSEPIFDAEVNILGSINLLESARMSGVKRIIYSSTGGAVYGEPEYLPCDEDHPINPLAQYGASKYIVEHYLFMYQVLYGLPYTILRYPNVYGPRQDPHGEAGVVAIFCGRMLAGDPVTIFGNGEQERDFVHVSDCAAANLLAINKGKDGIYNLGSGTGSSINEIFNELKDIIGYQADPHNAPQRLGETFKIYLTADRARKELGWEQRMSLTEGLEDTVNYFRSLASN
jgi:UDP-glucose 4-epimerase